MVLVHPGYHMRKNFSGNYPQFWARVTPVLGQKNLKNIGTKGRQIFGVPRAPTSNTSDASRTSSYTNFISEGYFGSPFRPAAAPQILS